MRIAVGKACRGESVAENLADGCRITPSFTIDADSGKLTISIERHLRRRK
jgi:hypothetical protein